MRKDLLTTILAASALFCCGSASAVKVTVTPLGERPADDRMKTVTVSKADPIVTEDFSAFTAGTNENPDWDNFLCSYFSNAEIDPELTHGAQWTGHRVAMAGGSAGLFNLNPSDPSYICTPKMDYSGTITVTFLAKALFTEWEEEDENGEMKKFHFTSTSLMARLGTDDYDDEFDFGPDFRGGNFVMCPLFPDQGWCEVTIEFDNYTAHNDAFFQIACSGHMLVDDVKIKQSIDKFIGRPVVEGFTAATEDSFTIAFQPVRKSSNYYVYLYELKGYDGDGNPLYKTVKPYKYLFSEEELKEIEEMGYTVEEYLEDMAKMYGVSVDELLDMLIPQKGPYNHLEIVDSKKGATLYTFTYEDLDPAKQYYFDVRSHNQHTFSPENIRPVNVIGTPVNLEATDVTENGFTANWSKITKAEGYTVDLYGVNQATEDEENFIVFEEDFDATNDLTDATDINNPELTGENSDIVFDDLTSTPGWKFGNDDYILLVKGKAGLGVDDYGCYRLTSPTFYVANADQATLSLCVESPMKDYEVRIRFADEVIALQADGNKLEGEITLPTKGLKETNFAISGPDEAPIFIDYITVTQPLKKGDNTYTWLGRYDADKENTSYKFENLDKDAFGFYAYRAGAWMGEGSKKIESMDAGRMLVNLTTGKSEFDLVGEIEAASDAKEVARYTLDGRQIDKPVPGINIVRYNDGSVRKVFVK
ncbi:MAG: hypothetical protein U0L83_07125 [Muribaculaceae bacterium]|nr:hypothetical protein [Muribaculaceae bacterium]